jgi:predicted RNase H-like nuclease (RuvC/YqgF family)
MELLKAYTNSQFEKKELTKQFADRLNQIKEINYYRKKGNKVYKQKFGMNEIVNANTKLGKRKLNEDLLFLLTDKGGAGYFQPDNPINKKAREIIRDKKLPPELMNKLNYIKSKFEGAKLRDE